MRPRFALVSIVAVCCFLAATVACGPVDDDSSAAKLRALPEAGSVMPGAVERNRRDDDATEYQHTMIDTLYVTDSSPEQVVAYYQSLAESGGWQLATKVPLSPGQGRQWRKDGYVMAIETRFTDGQREKFQGEFKTMFTTSFWVTVRHPEPIEQP
ncbi:MAG: hypothetical protein AB7J35_11640 [Dehalococcoidia bacterium]